MVEGVDSILFTQAVEIEKRTAYFRFLYFLGLFCLFLVNRNPLTFLRIDHLIALLGFILLAGYSVVVLVLVRRDSFHERIGYLSNALDAIGAAIFFAVFLSLPAEGIRGLAVVLSEIYFFFPIVSSIAKVKPLVVFSATIFSTGTSGTAIVVHFLISAPGTRIGYPVRL